MIQKIIHLCWLSGDAFPADIVKCLETWKKYLKDYEIWLWGKKPQDCLGLNVIEKHFDLDSTIWTKQAFEAKKYAFAADYIRLYALYNFGGIYLDADVLVYKSFDELLSLPYFIGCDQIRAFEAAVIGAEKGCSWIKDIFDTYQGKHFVKEDGSLDRGKMRDLVFQEPKYKAILEEGTTKVVLEDIEKIKEEKASDGEKALFFDIPLLFETHQEGNYDQVWVVTADLDLRKQRVMARDNIDPAIIDLIIGSQADENKKECIYFIHRNEEIEHRPYYTKLILTGKENWFVM